MSMKTLTPAYGRDYKSKEKAIAAYKNGSDWILHDITSRWDGAYCSSRDFVGEEVKLRFNGLRDSCLVTFTD